MSAARPSLLRRVWRAVAGFVRLLGQSDAADDGRIRNQGEVHPTQTMRGPTGGGSGF